MKKIKVWSRY